MGKKAEKLNPKHEAFINEYLSCFNGTKAYLKVYPDSSEDAARGSASDLLTNPIIRAELTGRIDAIKGRIPEDIIAHLKNLIFFNVSDILDDNGNIDKAKVKSNSIPGIISGISIGSKTTENSSEEKISFKLTDQNKAIELLSKILKLYDEKPELKVQNIVYLDKQDAGL